MPTHSSTQPAFAVHRLLTAVCLGGWLALAAPLCVAQTDSYPSRPITIVIGYPPGGSTDLTGRTIAADLAKRLGVPVVVENAGGAGGTIGAQKVANAPADGFTLLVGANNEIAISRLVSASVKYQLKDFTPIGLIASQPMVLVASSKSGVKNMAQFLSTVKKHPGQFSYGSSGVGTALHLAGEMIKDQGGLFMTHIPYRGVAPLANDLLGNNIEFGVFVLSSALPHIKSGRLLALGTTESKRAAVTPDIPALAESPQLKGLHINSWFALMAPAGLPEGVTSKLKRALAESLQTPDVRKKLEDSGSAIAPLNVDMAPFLATETATYQKIVNFANIKE